MTSDAAVNQSANQSGNQQGQAAGFARAGHKISKQEEQELREAMDKARKKRAAAAQQDIENTQKAAERAAEQSRKQAAQTFASLLAQIYGVQGFDEDLQTFNPSGVKGTFTATLSAISRNLCASFNIVSKSVAATSALTGPSTMSQISLIRGKNSLPAFLINDGFVVTPSSNPVDARSLISSISAVSIKNFMWFVSL
jgi:hypothetical protein